MRVDPSLFRQNTPNRLATLGFDHAQNLSGLRRTHEDLIKGRSVNNSFPHRSLKAAVRSRRISPSPFLRAQATALATTALYPGAAFETWSIHEFTYLAPARCVDTTLAQRRGWVDAYWQRSDPAFSDGEGAESFLDLVARALHFLDRIAEHSANEIVVFSHGQYLNTVRWLLEKQPQEIDGDAMLDWRKYEIANHIPNCQGFSLSRHTDGRSWALGR